MNTCEGEARIMGGMEGKRLIRELGSDVPTKIFIQEAPIKISHIYYRLL